MKIVRATRITPLPKRKGTWPILVQTGEGAFIFKSAGSGHGTSALIADAIASNLAAMIGLRVPEIALVHVDHHVPCDYPDPEIVALIDYTKPGLGFRFMPRARNFSEGDFSWLTPDEASLILWFDWWIMNPDRTESNPNLLVQEGKLWPIDHGSALYFHHDWPAVSEDSPLQRLSMQGHAFSRYMEKAASWHRLMMDSLSYESIQEMVCRTPDEFFLQLPDLYFTTANRRKAAYAAFLWKRLKKAPFPEFLADAA